MNEVKFYEMMSDYLDNNLDKKAKLEFEKTLSQNKELKNKYEDVKHLVKKIKNLDTPELSEDFDINLKRSINRIKSKELPQIENIKFLSKPIHMMVASVAAAIVLVVVTTFFFNEKNNQSIGINFDTNEFVYNDDESEKNDFEIDMTKGEQDVPK